MLPSSLITNFNYLLPIGSLERPQDNNLVFIGQGIIRNI